MKRLLVLAVVFSFFPTALFAQVTYGQMKVIVHRSDGKPVTDRGEGTGLSGVSSSDKNTAPGGNTGGNIVTNMDVRIAVLGESGETLFEDSPNSEGIATFTVPTMVLSSQGQRLFPSYRLRVFGAGIQEQFIDNVQPGSGDRMVNVTVYRKGEKVTGGGLVSATALKVPGKAEKEYDRGAKALTENKLDEARDHFEKAVAIYPQYDAAYNGLGVTLMKSGQPEKGRAAFEKAIEVNDKFAAAYVNLARIEGSAQHYDEAANLLNRSLSSEPLNPDALSLLCQYDLLAGKYNDIPDLAKKLHSVPHDGQALCHYAAGNALETLGKPDEALVEYVLFVKEAPPDSKLVASARDAMSRVRTKMNEPATH